MVINLLYFRLILLFNNYIPLPPPSPPIILFNVFLIMCHYYYYYYYYCSYYYFCCTIILISAIIQPKSTAHVSQRSWQEPRQRSMSCAFFATDVFHSSPPFVRFDRVTYRCYRCMDHTRRRRSTLSPILLPRYKKMFRYNVFSQWYNVLHIIL